MLTRIKNFFGSVKEKLSKLTPKKKIIITVAVSLVLLLVIMAVAVVCLKIHRNKMSQNTAPTVESETSHDESDMDTESLIEDTIVITETPDETEVTSSEKAAGSSSSGTSSGGGQSSSGYETNAASSNGGQDGATDGDGIYYDPSTGLPMYTKPVGNTGLIFNDLSEYEQWKNGYFYSNRLKAVSGVGDEVWNVTGMGSKLSCDYPLAVTSLAVNEFYDPDVYQSTGELTIKYSKPVGTSGKTFDSVSEALGWFSQQKYNNGISVASNDGLWPWNVTGDLDHYSIDAPVASTWKETPGNTGKFFASESEASKWCSDYAAEQGIMSYVKEIWPVRPGGGVLQWTCNYPS